MGYILTYIRFMFLEILVSLWRPAIMPGVVTMENWKVIASTPAAILCTLGGIGFLAHIAGAGWLLLAGIGLQILWILV